MQSRTPSWEKRQCFLSDGTSRFAFITLGFNWGPISSLQQSQPSLVGTPRELAPLTHLRTLGLGQGHALGHRELEISCALDFCQPSALSRDAKDGDEY